MGLTFCPDCNGKVSDRATLCVHCGAPLTPKETGSLTVTLQQSWFGALLNPVRVSTVDGRELMHFEAEEKKTVPIMEKVKIFAEVDTLWPNIPTETIEILPNQKTHILLRLTEEKKKYRLILQKINTIDL